MTSDEDIHNGEAVSVQRPTKSFVVVSIWVGPSVKEKLHGLCLVSWSDGSIAFNDLANEVVLQVVAIVVGLHTDI